MGKAKNPPATPALPGQDGYEPATAKMYADTDTNRGKTGLGRVREPGVQGVHQLSGNEEVAARTGPDAPADGKFRKTFVLSGRDAQANQDSDDFHRANQVATLQEALMRGVHPQGDAELEGVETTHDGSVRFTYAVDGVPASEDEVPADTQTPAKAIKEMGGSTTEHAQDSREYGTLGAATATEK